ncbi:hypothetical protein NGM10_01335 [Halorussus salilacus]|uniref:hypothetical protein n=1 Tax=Halorussus salilacus TaxID=2953750 RepID=UPI00209F72CE|nr:hypothetical protein [Halorussus salilacus]USZ68397.1 hypothetical protein NGM10_01335 [Halorussus salilacus]
MVLSIAVAGVALGADVQRGGEDRTFNPGVGGPNDVVVSEQKPVVFQGEDDINFVGDNGQPVDPSTLIGVSGNAEGVPLESPIPRDQELGQYAANGRSQNPGVTVQRPRVTDLEVFNERAVDVEGSSVQEDETLLIRGEWNFQNAEDLSLTVTDEDGNEITGDVLTDTESLSDAQREELTGAYAEYPEKVANPGQRGTGTGIEHLQGVGQFEEEQLQNASVDAAYWAIDLSDQDAGDYTITIDGWDNLDFDSATRSSVVSLTTDRDIALDLDADAATRGENVRYTVRGSTAGASHYVTIEDNDFRNNQVNEQVFRDVEDVVDRGSVDTNDDGEADFAWAQIEIDEDTGLGVGQIDTTFLDDTNVDVNVYEADRELDDIADDIGDTEDDRTLDVQQGTLSIESPMGTYIAGQEVDLTGTAAPGVDDVAIYVRDQGDWELVDVNEDGQFDQSDLINVDSDGEWEERDVTLSQANDILSIPGRYRFGVVEAEDVVGQNDTVQETLTTSEFSSATSEQTSIIVGEPTLGAGNASLAASLGGAPMAMQDDNNTTLEQTEEESEWVFRTYNEEVAVEDGTVEVAGVAPGLDEVLVVMVDTRGRVVTETISVDDNDVFEEDDIELITQEGRQLNEGEVRAMVIGLGRDTVVGDGVLPGEERADLAGLENWIQSFGAGGLTQAQVTERITDETTDEAGSDDLMLQQQFRYADARTSVQSIAPEGEDSDLTPTFQRQISPVEADGTMVVQGLTNRQPDDNTITVEVIDGPSADDFDSAATDEWDRTGVWSVNLSTEGIEPGTYTLEVDDGDNTDVVQFEVVEPGEAEETTPAENETADEDNETETADENETADELPNTLEISAADEDDTVTYTMAVDGNVEVVSGINATAAEEELAEGSLTARTSGTDSFEFAGQITEFSVEGDAEVLLNGEEVDPDEVANATAANDSVVAP